MRIFFIFFTTLAVMISLNAGPNRSFQFKKKSSRIEPSRKERVVESRPQVSVRDAQSKMPQGEAGGEVIKKSNGVPLSDELIEPELSRSNEKRTNQFDQVLDNNLLDQEKFRSQGKTAPIVTDSLPQERFREDGRRYESYKDPVPKDVYSRDQERARVSTDPIYNGENIANKYDNPRVVKAWDETMPLTFEGLTLQDINRYQFRRNRPDNIPVEAVGQ